MPRGESERELNRSGSAGTRTPSAGLPALAAILAPALVAVVLALPRLTLGFFWDDYIFLTNAQASPLTDLLPTPGYPFYRPLPRGALFDLLLLLGPHGALAAHALNLALLAASSALVASLALRLAGPVAGLLAGLAFAAFGPAPGLVAWASGAQDLFAIAFGLAALRLRHDRRALGSALALAAALLSKEPAVLFVPVLILWDYLLGRRPFRVLRHAALYGGIAVLWAAAHPALRVLAPGSVGAPAPGYLGPGAPGEWALRLGWYAVTLLNLPITWLATPWPGELTWAAAAAAVIGITAYWGIRRPPTLPPPEPISVARAAGLAAVIAVPQLLLPALTVRVWLPYFACLAAIGSALWLGVAVARAPASLATLGLVAYVGLGVWCRGMDVRDRPVFTEQTFVEASRAARALEGNFHSLTPTLPRGTLVSLSIGATGRLGIHQTLTEGRALRIWYSDPALTAVAPERHRSGGRPEVLMRVTSDLTVVEIDPDRIDFRWEGSDSLDAGEVTRPIRAYWRGAAASGQVDRAVAGLRRLAGEDDQAYRDYDRRLAAMLLLAARRQAEARSILDSTAALPRGLAVDFVKKLLSETSGDATQDSSAFPAFGISASDPGVARYLMRAFHAEGQETLARQFALRVQEARPGDMESEAILRLRGPSGSPDRGAGR